jgi:hypothetical protein
MDAGMPMPSRRKVLRYGVFVCTLYTRHQLPPNYLGEQFFEGEKYEPQRPKDGADIIVTSSLPRQ